MAQLAQLPPAARRGIWPRSEAGPKLHDKFLPRRQMNPVVHDEEINPVVYFI
jgi:hypothetical protein